MKKNKILFIISVPFYKSSGSPLAVFTKVEGFLEIGYDVDIVCYPHGDDIKLEGLHIIRAVRKKIFKEYIAGQYKKKLIYDFLVFLKSIFLLRENDYNFVITVGSMIYYGRLLNLLFKNKFIALQHGNIKNELSKWGVTGNNKIGNFARKIEVSTLNSFFFVMSDGESAISPLYKYGLKKEKVEVVFGSVKSKPVLEKKNKTNNFIVLYAGTFVKVQNLDLIIETAKLLLNDKIEFRLIGGESSQVDELKSKIKDIENIKIFYRLPQVEFEEFFSEADIVVSPRVEGEDSPMKIVEYLNFGKCILATDVYLHRALLNNSNSFLAKPEPQAFSEAITLLKSNPELMARLANNGKKYFEENLSSDIMKNNLVKVLRKHNLYFE